MIQMLVLPDGRQTEVQVDPNGFILDARDGEVVKAAVAKGIARYASYGPEAGSLRAKLEHVQLAFDLSKVEAEEALAFA